MRTFPNVQLEAFKNSEERTQIKTIIEHLRQVSSALSRSVLPGQAPPANPVPSPVSSTPTPPTQGLSTPVVGDMIYSSSAGVWAKLPIGTAGQYLRTTGGIPVWSAIGATDITTLTLQDANFTLQDDGDLGRQAKFQLSGITTGNTRVISVPDFDGTLLLTTSAPTINTFWNFQGDSVNPSMRVYANAGGGVYVGNGFELDDLSGFFGELQITSSNLSANRAWWLPDASGQILISGSSATLVGNTNSTLASSTAGAGAAFQDNTTNNKKLRMILSTCTAATNTALRFNSTASRTIDLPDASDTLVARATTDTLTNKTLSSSFIETNTGATAVVLRDAASTSKRLNIDLSGLTTATHTLAASSDAARTWTLPNHTMTIVGTVGTDTKTAQTGSIANVTLYTPPLNNGMYRLSAYAVFTAVTAPGTLSLRATWTDVQATHTDFALPGIDTLGAYANPPAFAGAGDFMSWDFTFQAESTGAIQYDTNLTGTGTYSIFVKLEALP